MPGTADLNPDLYRLMPYSGDASGKTRENKVRIVIGPAHRADEVGLECPLAVQISRIEQLAWGLIHRR